MSFSKNRIINILMIVILCLLVMISFYSSFSVLKNYAHTIIAPIVIDCVIIYLSIAKVIFNNKKSFHDILLYLLIATTVYLNYSSTTAIPENYVRALAALVYIFLLDYLILWKKEQAKFDSIYKIVYDLTLGKIILNIRIRHLKDKLYLNRINKQIYDQYIFIKNNITEDLFIINKIFSKNIPLSLLIKTNSKELLDIIDSYEKLDSDTNSTFEQIIQNKDNFKQVQQVKKITEKPKKELNLRNDTITRKYKALDI